MTALYILRWFDQLSVTEYRSKISLRDDSGRGTVGTSGSGAGYSTRTGLQEARGRTFAIVET